MLLKVIILKNAGVGSVFQLPEKLRKMHDVVNVDCDRACFKHAVLSVLHYDDIKKHRQCLSKSAAWRMS